MSDVPMSRYQASGLAKRKKRHTKHTLAGVVDPGCKICSSFPRSIEEILPASLDSLPPAITSISIPQDANTPLGSSTKYTPEAVEWRSRAEQCARVDLSAQDAAIVLGMDVCVFEARIHSDYHISWDQLSSRMQLLKSVELQDAADRAARRGDWRPYLALFKQGLIKNPLVAKDSKKVTDTDQRIRELDQRIAALRSAKQPEGIPTEMLA